MIKAQDQFRALVAADKSAELEQSAPARQRQLMEERKVGASTIRTTREQEILLRLHLHYHKAAAPHTLARVKLSFFSTLGNQCQPLFFEISGGIDLARQGFRGW
jgi:hypothetical protein